MIKFFRQLRQRLLNEGKLSKYMPYALGEILLVVFGILIAMEVNNLNEERIEARKLKSYYQKLIEEADEQILFTQELIDRNDSLLVMQKKTLEILASKDKSRTPELLENIGSIATVWTNRYTLETFDEFSQQNLLTKVEKPELKQLLFTVKERIYFMENLDNYISNQYSTLIEPFFSKHINYSKAALPHYRKGFVSGGPETNFNILFTSLEMWNIGTFKLEVTNSNRENLDSLLDLFKELKSKLEDEI